MKFATCHPEQIHQAFGLCKSCYEKQYYQKPEVRAKQIEKSVKNHLKYRNEMFAALGDSCSCCGEREKAFLSLEHKNKDGAEHARRLGSSGSAILLDVRREGFPKDKYTVLCMNCQFGERQPGGCPHKRVN
jgi:hypothetical protein